MTDFLEEKRGEIIKRLDELKPLVEEYQRLEVAAQALAGVSAPAAQPAGAPKSAVTPARRGPGRPRGSRSKRASTATAPAAKSTTRRRPGRRKGSGTRAAEALSLVQGQPGITIPELASAMGIKQNYLYRVLPGLEQDKKITRKGRGWHPKG